MRCFKKTERGSALMLVPAGVLILLMLGAVAVDSSIAFMAHRELANDAEAAVNDAVTVAIPTSAIQSSGSALPDTAKVIEVVRRKLVGQVVDNVTINEADIDIRVNQDRVTVVVTKDVPYLFARSVPGARHSVHVVASASARLQARQK